MRSFVTAEFRIQALLRRKASYPQSWLRIT
jgi:hypothetical protein